MKKVNKPAFALIENIKSFIKFFGVEKCGFVTLTFGDQVVDVFEASKRFNSFRTGFLSKCALAYIGVYERHKSGVIHFHFVVAFPEQILYKTVNGSTVIFDYQAAKKRNYKSRNAYLGKLWKLFREAVPKYGFGERGSQILPISSIGGIAKYLSKYLAKGILGRQERDKGFRLVRCSRSSYDGYAWRAVSGNFSFVGGKSREWRAALGAYIRYERLMAQYRLSRLNECDQYSKLKEDLSKLAQMNERNYSEVMSELHGAGWCYKNKDHIIGCYQKLLKEKVVGGYSFNLAKRCFERVYFDVFNDSFVFFGG